MADFKPTPKVLSLFITDGKGDPIFEDSYLHASRWWPPHYTSSPAFLWHIERGKTGKLMLVADDGSRRVPLTSTRARGLLTYKPCAQLKLADHPEVWAWWRASGWGLCLICYDEPADWQRGSEAWKATVVSVERRNSGGGYMLREGSPELAQAKADPAYFRKLLVNLLFTYLHPRKAKALGERDLTEAELTAFEVEQRRKMKKLGIS